MSQILPRFNRRAEEAASQRKIARIILETGPSEQPTTVARATLAGDARRLRGIPALARGVGSAIPGTNPEAEAMRSVRRVCDPQNR